MNSCKFAKDRKGFAKHTVTHTTAGSENDLLPLTTTVSWSRQTGDQAGNLTIVIVKLRVISSRRSRVFLIFRPFVDFTPTRQNYGINQRTNGRRGSA